MNYRERAESTTKEVCRILQTRPSTDEEKKIAALIEQAVIDAVVEDEERYVKVVADCCPADRDLAHKIADEMHRANIALIANLSSMR